MKIIAWIEAMRLRTLPVSIAGVVIAIGFNIMHGNFKAEPAILCLVFAVLCQIASNFANEFFDFKAGRDKIGREGPRRGVTEGDITPRSMLLATLFVLLLAAIAGLSLTYWAGAWLIFIGIAVALGVFAYSAGPFPLSTHCLGEVGVFIFFGLVPVNFTYYVQALSWSTPVLYAAASLGLMGANVLIVNNYRDRDDDSTVGKHTLANMLPRPAMPILYCANSLVAVALMLPTWLTFSFVWSIVPALYIFESLMIVRKLTKLHGAALNPLLGMTSIAMLGYAILFVVAAFCNA